MAKHVLLNPWVRVNNVDLSDHVSSVTVNLEADDVDVTASGQYARDRVKGLRDESFEVEFLQDFAASSVDATLWPLYNTAGTVFLVEAANDGSTISATNPKYSGSCILTTYQPIAGAIGDANKTTVAFPTKGSITRGTA